MKSPHIAGGGGYDVAKRTKRRIGVDTDSRLLMVNFTRADVQDASGGGERIVKAVRRRWPWLKHLFADAAYYDFVIERVCELADHQGF